MLENVLDVTENCRHCLMCRHVCPVGNITYSETLTPHGWGQLVALERRGLSSWNPETIDKLYRCADCGSCRSHCVWDQALPDAIAEARANVAGANAAPAVVYDVGRLLRKFENPYEPRRPGSVRGSGDAALFVGDDTPYLAPSVLEGAIKLLRAVGVKPILIGKGRNSGFLASSLGLPDIARDLARATIEELLATGARQLFVLSPAHYFALGQVYDERLGCPLPADVELIEVIPFLAEQMEKGFLRLRRADDTATYAYIDPTHAVRNKARHEAPRKLLDAVLPAATREVFWRKDRAFPCGNLALAFTHPELSDALTRARLTDAERAGADGVITEGPGSLAHLERHAPGFGLRVRGLYELLADCIAVQESAESSAEDAHTAPVC